MGRASEARKERNREELAKMRELYASVFDALQEQIERDEVDNIEIRTYSISRDATTDEDAWVRRKTAGYKSLTLDIVMRDTAGL